MAFKEIADLDCDVSYALGGVDKKTNKKNPTQIQGYYVGSRQVPSKKSKTGFAALHIFQTDTGNVGIWGKTNLDQKLSGVTPGFLTRVTFTGMKETKNNPMYVYKVQVDKDAPPIEVSSNAPAANASNEDDSEGSGFESAMDEDDLTEQDFDEEEEQLDEAPPARTAPPKRQAQAPSAEAQRQVQERLRGARKA